MTSGHPDKLCDQLSDAILDEMLKQDKNSKVAIECMASAGLVHVAGELKTEGYVDIDRVVREVIADIGYNSSEVDFDANTCGIMLSISKQSDEINKAVVDRESPGAGDQGIMFGYACRETPELMPITISIAHRLAERLEFARKTGLIEYLRPDGKTQVTVGFEGQTPVVIDSIVLSTQHAESWNGNKITLEQIEKDVRAKIIAPVLSSYDLDTTDTKYHINPSESFVHGGPGSDAGLTGRKIIVDTYGGAARHGGGAFSGKDPSKVDRSGAYAMRWVAKNAVAAGLADQIEVQVAYAIGKAEPVGLFVETFGTEKYDAELIIKALQSVFDLRPEAIIRDLDLLNRNYRETATYGHFGRETKNFTWEKTNRVKEIKNAITKLA